jgi:hypothetical protein
MSDVDFEKLCTSSKDPADRSLVIQTAGLDLVSFTLPFVRWSDRVYAFAKLISFIDSFWYSALGRSHQCPSLAKGYHSRTFHYSLPSFYVGHYESIGCHYARDGSQR